MAFDDSVRLIWSLTAAGAGTAISASGNSGGYAATPNNRTAVDLRRVSDVWLSVSAVTATGTTPSLVVSLGAYDDQGNLFSPLLSVTALAAAGGKVGFGGLHGGSASAYIVWPEWGQVAWAVTGTTPLFSGCEIALYGR